MSDKKDKAEEPYDREKELEKLLARTDEIVERLEFEESVAWL